MLGSARVQAFVATRSADAARAFYADTLGLTLVADEPHALVFDAGGTELRVQKVRELDPHPFTSLGWLVPDIASTVRTLSERGVRFERYEWATQDERGIWTAGDGTRVAWFRDPDGNLLSLAQHP